LFQAFSQLDSSSKKRHEGTGLGLIICKQLCELLGGEIGVDSQFGKGSTFWFTIKGAISSAAEERNEATVNIANLPTSFNASVLIVDDKKVNVMVAKIIMMNLGCKVKSAANGQDAIDLIKKEKFDVVFMDIQMPEMDGVEATKIIKETVPNPPTIIALTANALSGDREKYISEGMDDYLSKPITKEAVQIVLSRYV
jgi:CheY-like chemotaxis protein